MRQVLVAALVVALWCGTGCGAFASAARTATGTAGVFQLPVPGRVERVFVPPPGPYAAGHRGVDLAAPAGGAVRAAGAGIIAFSGPVAGRWWLTIRHADGLETTYGGLARAAPAGRRVRAGEMIGVIAPGVEHLDWGARSAGTYLDPLSLLGRWRVRLVAGETVPW